MDPYLHQRRRDCSQDSMSWRSSIPRSLILMIQNQKIESWSHHCRMKVRQNSLTKDLQQMGQP